MNRKHLLSFLLLLGTAFRQPDASAAVQLARLRCELLTNPESIDAIAPRLRWELSRPARGLEQTAYQLLVVCIRERAAEKLHPLPSEGGYGIIS